MTNLKKRLTLFVICFFSFFSHANQQALTALFKPINTYQADFLQLVEQNGSVVQQSKGKVYLKKPLLFHWDYQLPEPMKLISNGKKLFHYDIELFQATVKPLEEVNSKLLTDLLNQPEQINETFSINQVSAEQINQFINPQLVSKMPSSVYLLSRKIEDSSIPSIVLVGANSRNQLNFLYAKDELGTNLFIFDQIKQNTEINNSLFTFNVPDGVDVLGDL